MTRPAPTATDDDVPRKQDFLELQTATRLVKELEIILQDVGNCGVSDAQTSAELENYLGGAFAAAHRWLLEKRLDIHVNEFRRPRED